VDVLNAALRKVTIMRMDKEGEDATDGYMQLGDLPLRERAANNLVRKYYIKLVVAVDTANHLTARHAKSSARGDVNNLLGLTMSALYSHFDIARSGAGQWLHAFSQVLSEYSRGGRCLAADTGHLDRALAIAGDSVRAMHKRPRLWPLCVLLAGIVAATRL
jgi:hypothetical protein